jgi:hypothetical protein
LTRSMVERTRLESSFEYMRLFILYSTLIKRTSQAKGKETTKQECNMGVKRISAYNQYLERGMNNKAQMQP